MRELVATRTKLSISVSPTTFRSLEKIAKELKLSKSNLIEGLTRGEITILSQAASTKINLGKRVEIIEQANSLSSSSNQTEQNNLVSQKAHSQLQRQLTSNQSLIEQLNKQLREEQGKLEKQYNQYKSLQQELSAKNQQISKLERQLEQIGKEQNSPKNNIAIANFILFLLIVIVALLVKFYYSSTTVLN